MSQQNSEAQRSPASGDKLPPLVRALKGGQHGWCSYCEAQTMHHNGKCTTCRARIERERIAAWNAQTTARKLADLRKRVEALEREPNVY